MDNSGASASYVRVRPSKCAIMLCLTVGLYSIVWVYRNWKAYAILEGKQISPVLRTLFFAFICYPLFKSIYKKSSIATIFVILLWSIGIIYLLLHRFHHVDPLSHMSFFFMILNVCFYTIIQFRINTLSDSSCNNDKYYGFTGIGCWLAIIAGLVYWILLLLVILYGQHFHPQKPYQKNKIVLPTPSRKY
jgi:hypothetical protein